MASPPNPAVPPNLPPAPASAPDADPPTDIEALPLDMLTEIASHLQNPRDIYAFTAGSRTLHRVDPFRTPVLRDFGRLLQAYEHAALTSDPLDKGEIEQQRNRRALLDGRLNMVPQSVPWRKRDRRKRDRRKHSVNSQRAKMRRVV
jgi:hypothetical protein